MVKIQLPKEIDIDIDVNLCKQNHNKGNLKPFSDKEIEARRKVFSGEDFSLQW